MGAQKRVGYLDANDVLVGLNYGVLVHSEVDNVWTTCKQWHERSFCDHGKCICVRPGSIITEPIFSYMSTNDGHSWELLGKPQPVRRVDNKATRCGLRDVGLWGDGMCFRLRMEVCIGSTCQGLSSAIQMGK